MNITRIFLGVLAITAAAFAASGIDDGQQHQGFSEYTGDVSREFTFDDLSSQYGGEFAACCGMIQPVVDPEEFSTDPHPSDNVITLESTCDAASTKKYYVDFENARVYTCSRKAKKELKRNPEKYLAEIAEQMDNVEDEPVKNEPVEVDEESDMGDADMGDADMGDATDAESGNSQSSDTPSYRICIAPTCYRM